MESKVYKNMIESSKIHWWWRSRKDIIETMIIKYLSPSKKYKILEIGCGSGANLDMLSKFGSVTGGEMDNKTYKYTKEEFQSLKIIKHKIPSKLNSKYDLICLFDVLEHIEDDKEAIEWIYNHLNQDGFLILTIPALPFLWSQSDIDSHHYRRYKVKDFKKLTEEKFHFKKLSYFNFFLFPLGYLIKLKEKIFKKPRNPFEYAYHSKLNKIFYKIFSSEGFFLKRINFPYGFSLIGVLQKK